MASDVVERLRAAISSPWATGNVVISIEHASAILLRLECAEEMANEIASLRLAFGDGDCEIADAVLAKWDALRGPRA